MKATLTFNSHEQADRFAKAWSRQTLRGHVVSAKAAPVHTVMLDGITETEKAWIDCYIEREATI